METINFKNTFNTFKAKNILCLCLYAEEFNRTSMCIIPKDIWDTLEVTNEGTNQVKELKINLVVQKYELNE